MFGNAAPDLTVLLFFQITIKSLVNRLARSGLENRKNKKSLFCSVGVIS